MGRSPILYYREVACIFIQVNHESAKDLYQFIQVFISKIRQYTETTVNDYASKDIDRCIHKLETYMNRVYHPELRSIRQEASSLYKAYLAVRDIDKSTAARLYSQYLDKKVQSCPA